MYVTTTTCTIILQCTVGDYPFGAETQMAATSAGYFLGFRDIRSLCLCRMTHKSCHFFFASCLFRAQTVHSWDWAGNTYNLKDYCNKEQDKKKSKVSFGSLRPWNLVTLLWEAWMPYIGCFICRGQTYPIWAERDWSEGYNANAPRGVAVLSFLSRVSRRAIVNACRRNRPFV